MKIKIQEILEGRRWWLPFAVLLILFTALRCFHINYDAPQDLSISAAIYTDEGFKTYASRNHKYYGDWKWTPEDEYGGWFKRAIVPTYLYTMIFKIFGVSHASLKTIPLALSFFSMVLIFFMVKRYYDIRTAYVAFILFGVNHFLMMYNRLAFYENFLLFFSLLALYSLSEFYRRVDNLWHGPEELKLPISLEVALAVCNLLVGCGAIVCGYLSKESMNIIIVSLIPFAVLYFFYSKFKLNSLVVHVFYFIIICILGFYIIAGHTGWFDEWFKNIHSITIFNISIGNLLPLKTNVGNFDPIYLSFIKSLFLEFVYNQPLVFFTGIFYAIMCYYRFLYQSRCNLLDMVLSSWLLFCFVFLSIMKYHPARYYLLLSVPLIILSARFIVSKDYVDLVALTKKLKVRSFFAVSSVYWFYFIFYTGVVFFVYVFPFSYRKKLYDFAYNSISSGCTEDIMPIALLILVVQIFFFLLIVPKIRLLKDTLEKKRLFTAVFLLSIVLNLFLTGRWMLTGTDKLYDISVRLGETLKPNSVLVGSWAPAFTLDNGLRSIVMQAELSYNQELVKSILAGDKVPVVRKVRGEVQRGYESWMPLYLIVSTNTTFDKRLTEVYKAFIREDRRLFTVKFGYFNVDMYRMDAPPTKEEKRSLRGIK